MEGMENMPTLTCPLCGKPAAITRGIASCNALPSICGYRWTPSASALVVL